MPKKVKDEILGKKIIFKERPGKEPRKFVLPPGKQPGTPNTAHPVDRELRRLMIWDRKLHGWSLANIGKEFNISLNTVKKELSLARNEDYIKRIEDKILGNLADQALEIYQDALKDKDLFVAKDVLQHVEKIADRKLKTEQGDKGISLQVWLQSKKQEMLSVAQQTKELPSASEEVPVQVTELAIQEDEEED